MSPRSAVMIKTYKNLNISADSQLICTKLSEQGSFFWAGQNESKKSYAVIKTEQKVNFSSGFSMELGISLHVGHSYYCADSCAISLSAFLLDLSVASQMFFFVNKRPNEWVELRNDETLSACANPRKERKISIIYTYFTLYMKRLFRQRKLLRCFLFRF